MMPAIQDALVSNEEKMVKILPGIGLSIGAYDISTLDVLRIKLRSDQPGSLKRFGNVVIILEAEARDRHDELKHAFKKRFDVHPHIRNDMTTPFVDNIGHHSFPQFDARDEVSWKLYLWIEQNETESGIECPVLPGEEVSVTLVAH